MVDEAKTTKIKVMMDGEEVEIDATDRTMSQLRNLRDGAVAAAYKESRDEFLKEAQGAVAEVVSETDGLEDALKGMCLVIPFGVEGEDGEVKLVETNKVTVRVRAPKAT